MCIGIWIHVEARTTRQKAICVLDITTHVSAADHPANQVGSICKQSQPSRNVNEKNQIIVLTAHHAFVLGVLYHKHRERSERRG